MIELASVISDLRDELERAIVAGEGDGLCFELEQTHAGLAPA
ncbi:trypco2 family protein [Actinospica sp.]|nr:trypco2 family protein [Actinospica sp.]HWG25236.1 trypco2 family protein [Actinospica sp.]